MSEPRPHPDPPARRAARIGLAALPWVALAGMTALWTRARRGLAPAPPAAEPPVPTAADFAAIEPGRGRMASYPWRIPALGWKDILWRTYREMGKDRVQTLAGAVTFYVLLATFPALAAFVSLYGLFSDVHSVSKQLESMSAVLPRDAVDLIGEQMIRLSSQRHATLSLAFVASTLLSVWSANGAMKALFDGLNIAYDEAEKRDYVLRSFLTYAATLATLIFLALVTAVLVAAPAYLHAAGLHGLSLWWQPLKWVIVYLIAATGFTLIYRYGPSRAHAKWHWVAPGGAGAAAFWLLGSLGFSWYVNHFTHFGVTYGSLGAMVAYMLWVWFSVLVVLIGAEFNAEIEHQTACDTTTGEVLPVGQRGATMADTVGKAFTVSPSDAVTMTKGFVTRQIEAATAVVKRLSAR